MLSVSSFRLTHSSCCYASEAFPTLCYSQGTPYGVPEQWRQRSDLALPDFSPEQARDMAATLIFPEAGSQTAARRGAGRPGGGDEE